MTTVSSYDLKQTDFIPKRPIKGIQRTLLKQNPAQEIKRILKGRFTHAEIANQAELKPQMVHDFLSGGAKTIDPETLKKILRVLLNHQIITLPKGSNLDGFVAGVAAMEPSFSRTSATAAGCASAGSNSNAQIALAAALEAQERSAGS